MLKVEFRGITATTVGELADILRLTADRDSAGRPKVNIVLLKENGNPDLSEKWEGAVDLHKTLGLHGFMISGRKKNVLKLSLMPGTPVHDEGQA